MSCSAAASSGAAPRSPDSASEAGRERPQRRVLVVPLERVQQHRARPRVLAARQGRSSAARRTSSTSRSVARTMRSPPPATQSRPSACSSARRTKGQGSCLAPVMSAPPAVRSALLLQPERRRLPHARVLIVERGAQRRAWIAAAGLLEIAELARGQKPQHRIVGDRLRRGESVRAVAHLRLPAQRAERDDGARPQLERTIGRRARRAQGRDRVGAPPGRALHARRQDPRQIGRPRHRAGLPVLAAGSPPANAASTASARSRRAPLAASTIAPRSAAGPSPTAAKSAVAAPSSSKPPRIRAARARSSIAAAARRQQRGQRRDGRRGGAPERRRDQPLLLLAGAR